MLTCEILLEEPNPIKLIDTILPLLDYEPLKMDVFFNEFKGGQYEIKFDKNTIVDNINNDEMKRLNSFSLYDSEYSSEKTTPFLRVTTVNFKKNLYKIEWIYYKNFKWLLDENKVIKLFNKNLVYLFIYNNIDVNEQINKFNNSKGVFFKAKNFWGRKTIVNGYSFLAAPLMYYGKKYFDIISEDKLLKFLLSEKIKIEETEIIKIKLFDYNIQQSVSNKNRAFQKQYWKFFNLDKVIDLFEKDNEIDFTAFLKERAKNVK